MQSPMYLTCRLAGLALLLGTMTQFTWQVLRSNSKVWGGESGAHNFSSSQIIWLLSNGVEGIAASQVLKKD